MSSPFSWQHSVRVILAMGWSDFLLKYRGSFLGFLWSFIIPLVKFLVIFHVFHPFVTQVERYHLYLFLGIILWEYFSTTTTACMTMVMEKASIIKKITFPRLLLIFSVGWQHLIILATYVVIFLGAGLYLDMPVGPGLLYIVVTVLQATLLALGIGMLLSSYFLRFRDLKHLWSVFLQLFFWLTPIIYVQTAISSLPSTSLGFLFDAFIRLQPLSILIQDARAAILYPDTIGVPGVVHTVLFTTVCALIFVAGLMVFKRRSRYFIQEY